MWRSGKCPEANSAARVVTEGVAAVAAQDSRDAHGGIGMAG
jgi:hypothetical protein